MPDILPSPGTYERELKFMPYKKSLETVLDKVANDAKKEATVLDLMCGPGYLLGQLQSRRPDLNLRGVDIDPSFIEHGRGKYSGIDFELADVRTWQAPESYDVVLCTGALHHLPYEDQEEFIEHMAGMMHSEGFGILSDCYIGHWGDYENEIQRKLAAAQLGHAYLRETIANGAPDDVVEAAANILTNDVMGREFKTTVYRRLPILQKVFGKDNVETTRVWPSRPYYEYTPPPLVSYGDYIHILKR